MELAAARLAVSTLSPIITKLGSYVYNSTFGGDVTAEDMRNLNDVVLFKIKTVIQEAELLPLDHLRPWLDNLQAAAFEAEDLLDLYEYKRIKNQVSSLPKLVKKSIGMTKESLGFMLPKSSFKICLEKLQKSAEEAEELLPLIKSARKTAMKQLEYKSTQASTSNSTVSSCPSPLFGRKNECDIIIQLLLHESHAESGRIENKIPIIAIKGIGGSGKTAIAQGIYNDYRVVTHFDLRMLVHVSHIFDVRRLTKEIIESATKDECPQISNLDVLQIKLKEPISKHKRFLLVLDDIWCVEKMQWDKLLSPLNEVGGKGSRIVITTRMEEVTSNFRVKNVISLKDLKIEDCWSILMHYAFYNSEKIIRDKKLEEIGSKIINRVKYSPLALRVVGSLLGKRVCVDEWDKILKQDVLKEIMDVLLSSFLHLPSHLQRCFAYCSLYPKGHKFYSDRHPRHAVDLISLWITQGFIENKGENEFTLEEQGNIYLEELLSYSFFEKHHSGYYVIHDLLHDLAEKVSKKHCHRIEDHDSLDIPATCTHLSMYMMEDLPNVDVPDISKLKKLRTLIIFFDAQFTDIFKNKKDIFLNLTNLRALYVEYDKKMEVLSYPHIDKLKHLRYLGVQYDKKLPGLLAKLYHLQYFYLCTDQIVTFDDLVYLKADTLPQGFGNLINLRILVFYDHGKKPVGNWYYYNSGISLKKLTSLQYLTAFRPKRDSVNGIMLLKNLRYLCGSLSINNLENVKSKVEAAEAKLNQKEKLRKLTFEWSITPTIMDNSSNTCEEVLEGLEPHPNLEELKVIRYEGVKAPNWMIKENWLPRLRFLSLSSCKSLKDVPYLPPCLKFLVVSDCDELVQLPPVGSIISLHLENCPKLKPPSMSMDHFFPTSIRNPMNPFTSIHIPDPFFPTIIHIHIERCLRNGNQLFSDLPLLTNLQDLKLIGFSNLQTLPNLSPTVKTLWIEDFSELTSMGKLYGVMSVKSVTVKKCPMLEGGIVSLRRGTGARCDRLFPCVTDFHTDEPLSILSLVQQQSINSIEMLTLNGLHRPFPSSLQEHFHHLSSLHYLMLHDFTTLPNFENLFSLAFLSITNCPDVEVLPNLPISLRYIDVHGCPNLKVNYEEGGPLHNTISHIPVLVFD